MKPPEAIERLKEMPESPTIVCDNQDFEAIRLGIEALKRHQSRWSLSPTDLMAPLPGETED